MVNDLIKPAIGGSIGAYVVYEIVEELGFEGTGSGLMALFSLVIIAVAIMKMTDKGM